MRIYVAGSSQEVDLVEGSQRRLIDAGHTITHDWCAVLRKLASPNAIGSPRHQRAKLAYDDLRGAVAGDVFWLRMTSPGVKPSFGSGVELGYTLGSANQRPRIIVSGDDDRSIFTALASENYKDHEEAFQSILRLGTHGAPSAYSAHGHGRDQG